MLVGFLATAITLAVRLLAQNGGVKIGRVAINIVLYAVALLLSGAWTGVYLPPFPPFSDPITFGAAVLQFVAEVLANAAPVVGLATLIYNLLYEKVVVPFTARFK